ncbi:MAG: hypothetical protein K0Q92_622 [Steroidobacteraceae bacterium]|jgi:hypothetical protein|nr:hypothetical protein [Steroidobacteraceae bacterium]
MHTEDKYSAAYRRGRKGFCSGAPLASFRDPLEVAGWQDAQAQIERVWSDQVQTLEAAKAALAANGRPKAQFDDPRVRAVYRILCSAEAPPADQHWEGWVARRIVDAMRVDGDEFVETALALADVYASTFTKEDGRAAYADLRSHLEAYAVGRP